MIPLSSRRTLLKGLPVALAGLATTSVFWDRLFSRAMAQTVAQKRLLIWFVPDGLVPEWFWFDQPGPLTIRSDRAQDNALGDKTFNTAIPTADRPTFVLQPLAKYASRILMPRGINNAGTDDHVMTIQSVLTGEEVTAKGQAGGPSIDVIMADANRTSRHIVPVFRTGVYIPQTDLTGAGQPFRLANSSAFVAAPTSITTDARVVLDSVGSRASTGMPMGTPEPNAAALNAKSRLAALGAVRARVEAFSCVAGNPAGQRLEALLADVARLEELEREASNGAPPTATTPFSVPAVLNPNDSTVRSAEGDIKRYPEVAAFLRELVVTSLALDYAPCVTVQWGATGVNKVSGNTLTDYRYDFLPGFENPGAGEHGLAHPADNGGFGGTDKVITGASSTRDRVRIRRWLFNQLALVLDRLAETADGEGSLLDNTTILYASEYGGPNANSTAGQHSNRNLPYMLMGGSNSPFALGQGLNIGGRSHGDFLYTVAKGLGSTVAAVGKGRALVEGVLKA